MEREILINELTNKLNGDRDYAEKVADLLEDNSLIGQNNRKKIINIFITELEIDEKQADDLYNTCCSIVAKQIKNKIFHPFKKN